MNNMNIDKDVDIDDKDDINIYDQATIDYYYQTGKTVMCISCNKIVEIISILCIVICSILLIVSTWVLTTSIYVNVLVSSNNNHSKNQYRIPKINNSMIMYVTTICNRISDCFDIYRIDTHPNNDNNLHIKQEHLTINTENSYDDDVDVDVDVDVDSENEQKNENIHNDTATSNNDVNNDNIDSDIEDITEQMLQLKKDNTVVIDLCDDTTPEDDTIHTTIGVTSDISDISGGLHYNTSDSDIDDIIDKEIDNEIDKLLYYNSNNDQYSEEYKPKNNHDD